MYPVLASARRAHGAGHVQSSLAHAHTQMRTRMRTCGADGRACAPTYTTHTYRTRTGHIPHMTHTGHIQDTYRTHA
eukprot:11303697-Alexandrium_andersonii.AAC.1